MLRTLIEAMLLPPLNCLVLVALGVLLLSRARRIGVGLMASAVLLLWAQSTPYVSSWLLRSLQTAPALDPSPRPGDEAAIVVLSADMTRTAEEFGGPTDGALGLVRLRYGAWGHNATGVPLLVSGGVPALGYPSLGESMKATLERSFGVPVRWVEASSRDTYENARDSAAILTRDGVEYVYLVTHAWHMPRAVAAFEAFGVKVTPAPTGFRSPPESVISGLVPRWTALRDSAFAMHEYLGMVWYRLARF